MRLLLLGLKHVGKSSVVRSLARSHSMRCLDLDDLIVEGFRRGATEGETAVATARDLYLRLGADGFRRLEIEAARRLALKVTEAGGSDFVAALGGGTVENEPAMRALVGVGRFVYLRADADTLFGRMQAAGLPPFLRESERVPLTKARATWERLHRRRALLCEGWADAIIDVVGLDVASIAERVLTICR